MLKDDDFTSRASVDRYGRKLDKGSGRKELKKYYRIEGDERDDNVASVESGDEEEVVQHEFARLGGQTERPYDPARDGGFSASESSDEESEQEEMDEVAQGATLGDEQPDVPLGEATKRIAVVNLDWDNIRAVDLMAVAASFCPPTGKLLQVCVYPSDFGKERMEREALEGPPPELFSKNNGREEDAVPKPDVLDDDTSIEDDDNDDTLDDEQIKKQMLAGATSSTSDVDTHALRAYQLTRLRYFYAILTTDDPATALALYAAMDGREYLSTANFFDLRFVPDDVSFDDTPRDAAAAVPTNYRPNEFVTEALTHSKVRLTWDEEDKSRKEAQKRAFSRQEVDENDLRAYLGSDSDDDNDEDENAYDALVPTLALEYPANTATHVPTRRSKVDAQRQKLRAALGLDSSTPAAGSSKKTNTQEAETSGMQITFAAGLSTGPTRASVFANTPEDVREETTKERYVRKERERKARRKAKVQSWRDEEVDTGADAAAIGSITTVGANGNTAAVTATQEGVHADASADPFDDAFFADPLAANAQAKKQSTKARKKQRAAEAAASAAATTHERAELELLMAPDVNADAAPAHFDMAEIRKGERAAAKTGGKGRRAREAAAAVAAAAGKEGSQAGFEMDVADPRFGGVFDSHEFAIDPSNPRFRGTEGMRRLLEEGRRKRTRESAGHAGEDGEIGAGARRAEHEDGSTRTEDGVQLDELVKRVKRRA